MPTQTKDQRRAKRQQKAKRYAATAWGQNKAAVIELRVPSGQVCLVRTVGVPGLIEAGILDQVDSLTGLVSSEFIRDDGMGNPVLDIPGITDSQGAIKNIMEAMSAVVCLAVVEPKVYPVPMVPLHEDPDDDDSPEVHEDPDDPNSPVVMVEGEREEGKVYVDTVDEEDQVFIFQVICGGTQDLEKFRQHVTELVDGVDDESEVGDTTE